jgi:zeaxanthin glucosyltransferase
MAHSKGAGQINEDDRQKSVPSSRQFAPTFILLGNIHSSGASEAKESDTADQEIRLHHFEGCFMKIAFVTVRVPGHLYPMTTLARGLQARGHDVVCIAVPDAESLVRNAKLPFTPYCEREFPLGSIHSTLREMSKLQGTAALTRAVGSVADTLKAALKNLPDALNKTRAEAVVLDQVQIGLELVPMRMQIPYVHVSNALHFDFSGNTPFCVYDWPFDPTPAGISRNKDGLQRFMRLYEPVLEVGRSYAKEVGLDIDWNDPFATISKKAWLTQVPKEFDFPSVHWPPQFHHTGPYHDGQGRAEITFPWDHLTGEPLIYASMGTLQNGLESVFSAIAEAVGTRRGYQLVMSIGSSLDQTKIKHLPPNAIVVNHAPQIEILKRASLCITHAGLNTALESLAQGVPMVAIPVSLDQPGVAARIDYTKTGVFVSLTHMTVPQLTVLVDEVLDDPEYFENAERIKQVIADSHGLDTAVGLLEQAFDWTL